MRWLRITRLRVRLTVWYVFILTAFLILSSAGTCALLFWNMQRQLDFFSIQEIETMEGLLYFAPNGNLRIRDDYHNHPSSRNVIARFVEVRSPNGAVLFRNDKLGDEALGGPPFPGEGLNGYSPRSWQISDGTRVRVVSRVHNLDGHPLVIRMAHTEEPLYDTLSDLLLASSIVLPLAVGIAAVAGYAMARQALSPIGQIARRAREITADKLNARLPHDEATDELGELSRVFNQTLARLEQAFEQLRRFTSDASHELRTPLAMIRSVGEVGLQKDGSRAEYRDIIGSMLEEVNRLTSLIDSLLTISRADAGQIQLNRKTVRVMDLAREAAGLFEILIEEKSQRLVLDGDETAVVEGDYLFLRQSLVNILHNAIKYSPAGETISMRIRKDDTGHVAIEIQDRGPGVPQEDQDKIFHRFYRADKARGRDLGGVGLGLSIAKWAVQAHGGSIVLDSARAQGCTFRITLPPSLARGRDRARGDGNLGS